MDAQNKLRVSLIRKIENLPAEKLSEVSALLEKIEAGHSEKEATLAFAGAWEDLDDDVFLDLTERLHKNRMEERRPEL